MIRQTIKINDYNYIVELYKADTDDFKENITRQFMMFRKFDIVSGVAYDTDIYFVEKSLFDGMTDFSDGTLVWPQCNSLIHLFSDDFKNFNPDLTAEFIKGDAYELYERDAKHQFVPAQVRCDKVRIYQPNNKVDIDAIVYFDNVINNVHFHYYCRRYSDHTTRSETEFRDNYSIYSEYIEILIPNVEHLFSKEIYYKEDVTYIYNYKNPILIEHIDDADILTEKPSEEMTFISLENSEYNINGELIVDKWDATYCSLFMFSVPFYIQKNRYDDYEKYYVPNTIKTIETNYITYPINITLYPYDYNDDLKIYYPSQTLVPNTDVFVTGARFTISASIGFVDGKASLMSVFDYPNKSKFKTFQKAYEYYNGVSFSEYEGIEYDEDDEEYVDGGDNSQKQCGFEIIIATNPKMSNIICHKFLWSDTPDDFSFDLTNNLFESWDQMPELLICRTAFIDRYLGITIQSNVVIITKEWFKYILKPQKNSAIYRLHMDSDKFNFIDSVKCFIKKEETPVSEKLINKNSPTIIYKPIFYRVSDLQNIQIKSGLKQNVGVNLADYMTKVETFKMIIDGNIYVESARNDIFVIFNIDASALSTGGTYNIVNQDDEYISSGVWSII